MEDLQARLDALLARREVADTASSSSSPAPPPFSPFRPEDLVRARELAASWAAKGELWQVIQAAEEAIGVGNPDLVQFALRSVLLHEPRVTDLRIPPLRVRSPDKVVPTVSPATPDAAQQAAFETNPELRVAWWREDPGLNEFLEAWHVVHHGAVGGDGAEGGDGGADAGDAVVEDRRQAELFLYVNRQVLARYETERKALRLDPVQAWWPFTVASDPWGFGTRGPNQKWPDAPEMSAARQRLFDTAESGGFADPSRLGAALEPWCYDGHQLFAALDGAMGDPATAARDHIFWRWRKAVDDLYATWQSHQPPHEFADAPPVAVRKQIVAPFAAPGAAAVPHRSPDIILSRISQIPEDWRDHLPEFGQAVFGGEQWDEEFSNTSYTTAELHTTMRAGALDREEFVYFLRVDNHGFEPAGLTVRLFLAAQEAAEERRMWMEMDKFRWVLKRGERAVICRPAILSSVIRKPEAPAPGPGDPDYDCGWPPHLLLPRGRTDGMRFRLLVVLTDWTLDKVAPDGACGSLSLCGARDRYPDTRPMGYPFDRPLPDDKTVSQFVTSQPNMATRDITIRWMPPADDGSPEPEPGPEPGVAGG